MNSLSKFFVFVCLSGVFLSGSISMIDQWNQLTNTILAISCLGIIAIYIINLKSELLVSRILTLIFLCFIFFMMLSTLINENLQMLLSTIRYLLVFVTLSIALPNIMKHNTVRISLYSLILSQLPLLIFSFIEQNPFINLSQAYVGIFYNPNSFGTFTATLYVSLLSLLFISERKKTLRIMIYLGLIIMFLLTSFSGSRTSLLAVILVTITVLIMYNRKNLKERKVSFKTIRNLYVSIIIFTISIYLFTKSKYFEIFNERIVDKFLRKMHSGDVFDRRLEIYSETIKEFKLFGHGPEYFIFNFNLGAHNSFISILGQYGLLAALMFIVFWVTSATKSYKFYLISDKQIDIFPFLFILLFLLTSMTEIMLMKPSMLLALVGIGCLTEYSKLKGEKVKNYY